MGQLLAQMRHWPAESLLAQLSAVVARSEISRAKNWMCRLVVEAFYEVVLVAAVAEAWR